MNRAFKLIFVHIFFLTRVIASHYKFYNDIYCWKHFWSRRYLLIGLLWLIFSFTYKSSEYYFRRSLESNAVLNLEGILIFFFCCCRCCFFCCFVNIINLFIQHITIFTINAKRIKARHTCFQEPVVTKIWRWRL